MSEEPPNPRTTEDTSLIQGRNWFTSCVERLLEAITPPCARVVRLISASLDRPLTWHTRMKLRAHYLFCCYCHRYETQVRQLRRFSIALPPQLEEMARDRLPAEVKERIKARLRDSA